MTDRSFNYAECKKQLTLQKRNSYVGQKINRITILSWEKIGNIYYYNYTCECGTIKRTPVSSVYLNKIHSCGCYFKEWRKHKSPKPRSDIKKGGGSAARYVYLYYRRNAFKRNIEFNLEMEDFLKLTKQNCYYCNIAPYKKYKHHHHKNSDAYVYNGIDRLDNTIGYVKDNMVTCCMVCNRAKGDLTLNEFKQWLLRIKTEYNPKEIDKQNENQN